MVDTRNLDHEQKKRLQAAAYKRLQRMKINQCFDPIDIESRPTEAQEAVLKGILKYKHRYIRSGNQSGKTQIGAREASWIFEDTHPHWTKPEHWGDEPLILLIIGRVSKQVEDVLWRKIKTFLEPGSYKEQRAGGALQSVVNPNNGNKIIFASHHSENEAREKLQAYVAHYVWIDEMPGSLNLIEELHRRVQARDGYFLATFTPKVKNDEIRRYVDGQKPPLAKTFRLKMFDNPVYDSPERKEAIIASMVGYSEAYRNCLLYGDWMQDENTVYQFNYDTMVVKALPTHYSPGWRHVEAVDPALKSKFGFILLAEDPRTSFWYVIRADYISGIYVPAQMVEEVRKRTQGYNITTRVSDPHEVWYMNTANTMGFCPLYQGVYNKAQRKGELIKNLQTNLGSKIFIASWCTDLIDELNDCRWSETSDKIVNKSSYHLLDSLEYGNDVLPKPTKHMLTKEVHVVLQQQNEDRIQREAIEKKRANSNKTYRKQFVIGRSRWR